MIGDMSVVGHPGPGMLRGFLDSDYRQVWAVHRLTGERIYLAPGQAAEVREIARREWRCPTPGCHAQISTRGGSRRDHFFHVNAGHGHSRGESDWHLQAKAMLAQWATVRGGSDVVATEEETVKSIDGRLSRRADLMVTWTDDRRKVAFEVEYKALTAEAWEAKQADYRSQGIFCVWMFGHVRRHLRLRPQPSAWSEAKPWDYVKWTPATRAVGVAELPVLFVNPVERSIATLVHHGARADSSRPGDWWRQPQRFGVRLAYPGDAFSVATHWPRIVIDSIDACQLDRRWGLVTPTMTRVWAERERIRVEAESASAAYARR